MKNSLLKYALVLSLLLNFSFLGAAGYTYYQKTRFRTSPFDHGAPAQVPAGCSSNQPYLFEALSLKPEQRKRVEQKAQLFHEDLDQKGARISRLRESLIELMRADHPDNDAIDATIAEINGVQQDMQKMIVAHMLEIKSLLDRDQEKKFFDLIRGAMAMRPEIRCP
jgi:Spy/CpxP family protein refolding chaperone